MKRDFMFTSESVTAGHPDKLSDQISDAIVDQFLKIDPYSRINAECAVAKGVAFIAARFASDAKVDIAQLARDVIRGAGYERGEFSWQACSVLTSLNELSLSQRPNADERELSDAELERIVPLNQVTLFGFACNQTDALMPLPIMLAHALARRLSAARRSLTYLTPDGTTQVGVEYRERQPSRIHSINIVVSQNSPGAPDPSTLHDDLIEQVINPVFAAENIKPDTRTRIFVNAGGPRVGGGPELHSGLTGRKTGVDTYGEYARHSESALSGKDPLRVDRVAAYAARYAAKNVVAAGLAEDCEVTLSYSIGLPGPVSVQVDTFGTGVIDDREITRLLETHFDFRLGAIIRQFDLRHRPGQYKDGFYKSLSAYGQVGRTDMALPWEMTDKMDVLRTQG